MLRKNGAVITQYHHVACGGSVDLEMTCAIECIGSFLDNHEQPVSRIACDAGLTLRRSPLRPEEWYDFAKGPPTVTWND